VGELLWQLVKLYGFARVKAYLDGMGSGSAEPPPQDPQRLRVELVRGVPDSGFELLARDNDIFVWDEPDDNN
jgi:hypothetical protein